MNVKLKSLSIRDFKGIKSFDVTFENNITNIYGDNATGKTSIQDAFNWLFFGKDSLDRKVFDIKPKDDKGNLIARKEPEVEIEVLIDDKPILLTRTLIEKWERTEGTEYKTYRGNSTKYKINKTERSATDFNEIISGIANEEMFKLVTSPTYFCSLDDKRQRKMLIKLAGGEIEPETIISEYEEDLSQLKELLPNNTIENLKKDNDSKIKLIKSAISDYPTKILEAEKAIPEGMNWAEIEAKILDLKTNQQKERDKIKEIDDILADRSNSVSVSSATRTKEKKVIAENEQLINDRKLKVKSNLFDSYNKEQNLIATKKQAIEEEKIKSNSLSNKIASCNINKTNYNIEMKELEKKNISLINQYNSIALEEYNAESSSFTCPYTNSICSIVGTLQEEGEKAFLNKKAEDLKEIQAKGKANKKNIENILLYIKEEDTKIEDSQAQITVIEKIIKSIQDEINLLTTPKPNEIEIEEAFNKDDEIKRILALNIELTSKLTPIQDSSITPEQQQNKQSYQHNIDLIQQQIDTLNQSLGLKDVITKQKERVNNLNEELRLQSTELANLEKINFQIAKFNKIRMTTIEQKVNSMFEIVRFKMFNQLLNGGEEETCEAMINGVSWSKTLNSGAKINAGLDIINTFSRQFNLFAPIFIDNRESVSKLIDTKSQMINLIVQESAKSLIIK